MDELIGIVVLILYIVAAGAAGKNKKKKKTAKRAAGRREAQFEQAFERVMDAARGEIEKSRKSASPDVQDGRAVRKPAEEGADPCHEAMLPPQRAGMHLRDVSQAQMKAAGEGEDPCHTGEMPAQEIIAEGSPVYQSPIYDTEDKDAFAQEILRGVVMSEILARPERRRHGSMKRGA